MKSINKTSGFVNLHLLVITAILGVVCFSGWLVFNRQHQAQPSAPSCQDNQVIHDQSRTLQQPLCAEPAGSFDDCQKQPGSKTQESHPEVCVDVYGNRFPNLDQVNVR